ncbi:GTP pyrophosphokinase [Telluria beijingensis]|uniref:GTP pyrophosphokinase n=1 Tax=Telluria beijingensis TaxID=3068633 RepID=UPI0027956F90|nr:hypothetical protein [Massilia sp. REN29]
MSDEILPDVGEWYAGRSPLLIGLLEVVTTTISSLLKAEGIASLAVTGRIKTLDSIVEKMQRKSYASVEELTDVCGVRVISYIESDVDRIREVIEKSFHVHDDKSIDKSAKLKSHEFGYRSVHYICELGANRLALPELTQYSKIVFEVQIRTVLQHAWAEIEHDRSYKFAGELAPAIKRRLNLLAGTLELVDREFNNLAREVDEHTNVAKEAVHSKELKNVELTSAALTELLLDNPTIVFMPGLTTINETLPASIFDEIRGFGINTLEEFSELLTDEFLQAYIKSYSKWHGPVSLIRAAMLFRDMPKFLGVLRRDEPRGISALLAKLLDDRYGPEEVNKALKANNFIRTTRVAPKRSRRTTSTASS